MCQLFGNRQTIGKLTAIICTSNRDSARMAGKGFNVS